MKTVKIGLVGLGTVGRGVYDAIMNNGRLIAERTGISLRIKSVCDKDKKALKGIKAKVAVASYDKIIADEDIDIIVELIGGVEPAKSIILKAFKNGKHVVTANKALLSEHWKEIFKAASDAGAFIKFEASVGGAIPIIRVLRESLVANNISTIYGILNGTTNFILTEMSDKGCSFKEALKTAQERGIAESNPALDISGADSAHKLAILSLIAFGEDVSASDIYTEGIDRIDPQDIRNAEKWGYGLKLLGIAKVAKSGLELRVHPTLIPSAHLLSDVKGSDNAIFVRGDLAQEALLFGKGAGRKPTSSSVVSDIVDIARKIILSSGRNSMPHKLNYASTRKSVRCMDDLSVSCYLRFSVIDRPGVLAGIASILAKNNISIASVSQEERRAGEMVPVIIITHKAREGNMRKAIGVIDKLDYVKKRTVVIRIEEYKE